VSDEQFDAIIARLDGLQTDMTLQFATVNAGIDTLHRRIGEVSDQFRQRIGTAETTTINEIRALGERVERMNERVGRLETRS
jgi:hypothetical protein